MLPLSAGDELDNYQLECLIASGGMANVFRALDLRDGTAVAIKVPHAATELDPIFHDRFRREIEIGLRLDHPGIRKVLPTPGRRRLDIAMEWLDGQLLRHILSAEGPLPMERAVSIATQVLDALAHTHAHSVVHRDLKPENIVLDKDDRVKIIDFGIASSAGSRRLTFGKLSQVLGSPDYISPEQVKNKRGDARSDLYAAGAILYEMLVGAPPFAGENPFAVMNARLIATPAPPSDARPEIPPTLDAIVLRALERNPDRRYATAQEFGHDLAHPDEVPAAGQGALVDLRQQPRHRKRSLVSYLTLALVPAVLFALLL